MIYQNRAECFSKALQKNFPSYPKKHSKSFLMVGPCIFNIIGFIYQSNLHCYPNQHYIDRFQIHHKHRGHSSLQKLSKNSLKRESSIFLTLLVTWSLLFVSQKLPIQSQIKQYCFTTLTPQQSPPSKWHGTLLLISSHDPSDIHSSNPPAITVIRKLGKLQYKQIQI